MASVVKASDLIEHGLTGDIATVATFDVSQSTCTEIEAERNMQPHDMANYGSGTNAL
jgi:hypothetical protein